MKISRISFAAAMFVLAITLSTQAPAPMPLAHGNVPGEPHHHLKIENEYVRAYYAEVPAHESTPLHQHDYDYLYVSLGKADVINTFPDKPEVHLKLHDGETHFARGGFAHATHNLSGEPLRIITIDLLKPQLEAHNECGDVIPGEGGAYCDPPFVSVWYDHQFETAESRLDLVWIFSKKEHERSVTASQHAFLVIGLSSGKVRIDVKGKPPKTLRKGEMEWFDAGSEVEFSSDGEGGPEFLMLAFKDSGPHSSP